SRLYFPSGEFLGITRPRRQTLREGTPAPWAVRTWAEAELPHIDPRPWCPLHRTRMDARRAHRTVAREAIRGRGAQAARMVGSHQPVSLGTTADHRVLPHCHLDDARLAATAGPCRA